MSRKLVTTLSLMSAAITLTGCQTLATPFSDLRKASQPQPTEVSVQTAPVTAADNKASLDQPPLLSLKPSVVLTSPGINLPPIEAPALPDAASLTESIEQTEAAPSQTVATGLPDISEQSLTAALPAMALNTPLSEQLNWVPSLDDPKAVMDTLLSDAPELTQKINRLMSLAYIVDAQLYIQFRDLIDRLPEPARTIEIERQQNWLNERKVSLTRAFLEFKDEKAARYNAAQAFLRESNQRMQEIQQSLTQLN